VDREFLYAGDGPPSCHAATLAETEDGGLVAAWFGGTAEGEPDVGIRFARREAGGWSRSVEVARHQGVPCWNPVLYQAPAGPLLLFYKVGPSPLTWTGVLLRSGDGGRSWSAPEWLPAGILGPVKNKPHPLPDGTLVCGTSVESYRAWACWVERTPDLGRRWTRHGPIVLPGHPFGIIQPAVFGEGDRLAMLCRARDAGRIARAESADGGLTWSDAALLDLPQNNSGIDAVLLRDGRLLLAYNDTVTGRSPLNLAVSRDIGRTWAPGPVLEAGPGEFSYPAVIQARGGTIHVAYTWRRRRIGHAALAPDELP